MSRTTYFPVHSCVTFGRFGDENGPQEFSGRAACNDRPMGRVRSFAGHPSKAPCKPVQKSMADKPSPKQGLWKRRAEGRMLIGYMRVSTGEQSLDLQRDALGRAGCARIYDDVCSGRATERPGLAKALDVARKGDALVVWKLDRIGRSLAHVVGLVGDLQKHGVGLKVLTGDVDTTTATGRLVFGIFATLAEFERDLIHERTMAGLAAARARGRAGGRPRVMTKQKLKAAMAMMADRDNAARDVAAQLGVSLSTLYAYIDATGQPREPAAELLGKRAPRASARAQQA